ncbi:MAG TPA: hypothetical protein VLH19_05410 [Patescibacteria group bacterium]|nr:hypothetical protein [Patescibacteria group bacterium]
MNNDITVPPESSLLALQGVIARQTARLDTLREDLKKVNESFKGLFENDTQLQEAVGEAKEATLKQKTRKQAVAQSPESMQIKYKITEIKEQIKDLDDSLNNHLINYYQQTGVKFFDSETGEQREFDVRAKLKAKKL